MLACDSFRFAWDSPWSKPCGRVMLRAMLAVLEPRALELGTGTVLLCYVLLGMGGGATAEPRQVAAPQTIDLADPVQSLKYWLPHPVLGEASFDAFIQSAGNPVYVGQAPWLWPVNGFLAGRRWNQPGRIYVGLYQQDYKVGRTACNYTGASAGGCAAAMLQLQSDDQGESWRPWPAADPLACSGDPASFDKGTGCPDGSTAAAADGGVHLVWDWNVDLGDSSVPHAGLGYSHAPPGDQAAPGKFTRSATPLNDAVDNTPMDHGFVKLYGGTIIQRSSDWLIVSAIGGASWAMAGMTAPNAAGPYSHPTLLLWPQSGVYHPAPTEPYPAFRHGDFVYAPFTSVARNRGVQVMYRAPLEQATEPSAWEVVQTGSLYHWEGGKEGAIWGQTFSAYVDPANDTMEVMYPTLSATSVGSISLARRQWSQPFSHGFWVSAPAATSCAKMLKTLSGCFQLNMSLILPLGGAWALHWNDRQPVASTGGPGFPEMPGSMALPRGTISLSFDGRGGFVLSVSSSSAGAGSPRNGTCGVAPGGVLRLSLVQSESAATVDLEGCASGPVNVSIAVPAAVTAAGGGVVVEKGLGGSLYVSEMTVRETPAAEPSPAPAPTPEQQWIALLPSEAMGACYNGGGGRWKAVRSEAFTFGAGFVHPGGTDEWGYVGKQVSEAPMVKYNFVGRAARLHLPMGPGYGLIEVAIDDGTPQNISLYAPTDRNSSVVWRWQSRRGREPAEPPAGGSGGGKDAGDDPQQLREAHAVVVRWRAPSSPAAWSQRQRQPQQQQQQPPPHEQGQHPPWTPWVVAENSSAVFGVPIGGEPNAPLLGSNVTSIAQCEALCEAHENCTTYSMHIPGEACWAGKIDPLGWCSKCFGRTDGVWQLHPVAGIVSARRVAPPLPPPPPPLPPTAGTAFPVDVLEFLPAFAAAEPPPEQISNVVPRRDASGEILNSHDGNLVQDVNSGAFYLYGVSFPLAITAADYNNCVLKPPPGAPVEYKPTAYRSFDLRTWVLASADLGVHWQASDQMNVRFNRRTGKYVALYRGNCNAAALLVATADGPIGPFTQLPSIAILEHVGSQMAWTSDAQGRAYAMYNTRGAAAANGFDGFPDKQCLIELTPDWTNATGRKTCWVAKDGFGLEGGALWTRGDTYYWAAGSPCCNCYLGGSGRVYTTKEPMGNWSYLTNINPPLVPRPPLPPPDKRSPGSNPPPRPPKVASAAAIAMGGQLQQQQPCTLAGSWVGGVYIASGGQPLRGGLRISQLSATRYNFSQDQAHDSEIVGVGTVAFTATGVANITITDGLSKGAHGVADLWPGLNSSACFTRIIWANGACTWGRTPQVPETRFRVSSQMFGVATITARDGHEQHIYTGERYQTAPDGVFGHGYMYWQPLEYDAAGVPKQLNWTDGFALGL